MVKIGCPAVTTLQFQGLKEMDMASAVVLSSLPLTKKNRTLLQSSLQRGVHILSEVGFVTARRRFLQLKAIQDTGKFKGVRKLC